MRSASVSVPQLTAALVAAAIVVAMPLVPAGAQQQGRAPAANPGAGIVVGVVVDTMGRAIEGVTVFIDSRKRDMTTSADGTFRFDRIGSDSVTVATRRLGYFPQARRVALGKDGGSVIVVLVPRISSLPPSITSATVSGLGGIVSDTALHALQGAEVQAVGTGLGPGVTDSSGAFFIEAKPGHYMVRVTEAGHVGQLISVTVPEKGGRRLAIRLTPGRDPSRGRQSAAMNNLNDRLMRRSPTWSKVFTREDIAALNVSDVAALARIGASGSRVDPDCMATLDGNRGRIPLWDLDPDDVEFMEVYVRVPNDGGLTINPRGVTSLGGSGGAIRTQQRVVRPGIGAPSQPCPANIFVWTGK